MSGTKEFGGRGWEKLTKRYAGIKHLKLDFDPATQGGLMRDQTGNPIRQLRGPRWRGNNGDPLQNIRDFTRFYTDENPSMMPGRTGAEFEFQVYDRQGNWVSATNDNDPIRRGLEHYNERVKKLNGNGITGFVEEASYAPGLAHNSYIGWSPEWTSNMLELNFAPGIDARARNRRFLSGIKTLVRIVEENDAIVVPVSVIPNREIRRADITRQPYVQRIALDVVGEETMPHYNGTSFQTHVEMLDHESARKAINLFQLVSPVIYAGTLSGPFMAGQTNPDLHQRYKDVPGIDRDPLKMWALEHMPKGEHASYRVYGRVFGSPSGGPMREPLPENSEEFWDKAHNMLKSGEIPTAVRVGGHHSDFRVRVDLPPHGTIEYAAMDTAGARVQKLIALQEFTRALGWKLQYLIKTGKMDEAAKSPEYRMLFGTRPSADSYKQVLLCQ